MSKCTIENCDRLHLARGYCRAHYDWAYDRNFFFVPAHTLGSLSTAQTALIPPDDSDIAWAAGIYEGEGSVSSGRNRLQVTVTQKGEWLPLRLQELFGGHVRCTNQDKDYHIWVITGGRAVGFIQTIFYFMSPRRRAQMSKALAEYLAEEKDQRWFEERRWFSHMKF